MCSHHWIIDSRNFGMCKLCHGTKNFKPANDKFFGSSKLPRSEVKLLRDLTTTSGYPVQGSIMSTAHYRTIDYCFSVDEIE